MVNCSRCNTIIAGHSVAHNIVTEEIQFEEERDVCAECFDKHSYDMFYTYGIMGVIMMLVGWWK